MDNVAFLSLGLCAAVSLVTVGCDDAPRLPDDVAILTRVNAQDHVGPDGELPELPPPITRAETEQLRADFSWERTEALPETNVHGQPTLYYTLIYLRGQADEDDLTSLGVLFDAMPWFDEEQEAYDEQVGMLTIEGDDDGYFVFAFLPGAGYNIFREQALTTPEGPLLEAILLREVPDPAAVLSDGSLSYDYLVERGFEYWDEDNADHRHLLALTEDSASADLPAASASSLIESQTPKRCIRLCRRLRVLWHMTWRTMTRVIRGVVNTVRTIAGEVRRQRDLTVRVRVVSTEQRFGHPATAQSVQDELLQAWGNDAGRPLTLEGARLNVRANLSLTFEQLGANGSATLPVPRDKKYGISIRLRNKAAELVAAAGGWQRRLILYGKMDRAVNGELRPDEGRSGPALVEMNDLGHRHANTLVQMLDAQRAARRLFGEAPPRITVDVGLNIAGVGAIAEAFVACMSYVSSTPVIAGRQSIAGLISIFGIGVNFDIAFADPPMRSRGVPTHEYGHIVACDYIYRYAPERILPVMSEVTGETLFNDADGATLRVWEGLADFFAAQVAGGTNYFPVAGDVASGDMFYCDSPNLCLEDNIGGPTQVVTLGAGVRIPPIFPATVATILVDAFDGPNADPDEPDIGALWSFPTGSSVVNQRGPFDAAEAESIDLGSQYGDVLRRFARNSFGYKASDLYQGLADEMDSAGYNEFQICQLFALHEPAGDCSALVTALRTETPDSPIVIGVRPPLASSSARPTVELEWEDFSPDGSAYTLEVLDGADVVSSTSVPYSRLVERTLTELPYDRHLDFVVNVSCCDEQGAVGVFSTHTQPEPMRGPLMAEEGFCAARLTWADVEATSHDIVVVRINTGETFTVTVGDVTTANVELDYLLNESFSFQVFSVNAVGERTMFPISTSLHVDPCFE